MNTQNEPASLEALRTFPALLAEIPAITMQVRRHRELNAEYQKADPDPAKVAALRKDIIDLQAKIQVVGDKYGGFNKKAPKAVKEPKEAPAEKKARGSNGPAPLCATNISGPTHAAEVIGVVDNYLTSIANERFGWAAIRRNPVRQPVE